MQISGAMKATVRTTCQFIVCLTPCQLTWMFFSRMSVRRPGPPPSADNVSLAHEVTQSCGWCWELSPPWASAGKDWVSVKYSMDEMTQSRISVSELVCVQMPQESPPLLGGSYHVHFELVQFMVHQSYITQKHVEIWVRDNLSFFLCVIGAQTEKKNKSDYYSMER